jgi:adenylosuccinate lyase
MGRFGELKHRLRRRLHQRIDEKHHPQSHQVRPRQRIAHAMATLRVFVQIGFGADSCMRATIFLE